jgi:hypothetical protein
MYNDFTATPQIKNSIIWGNTASNGAGIWSGSGGITYSIEQNGGYPSTAQAGFDYNMTTDPFFMDLDPAAANTPTTGGNYRLNSTIPASPAINAGDPSYTPAGAAALDLDGTARIKGGVIDMGAYEKE